jgi:hypothetical protein
MPHLKRMACKDRLSEAGSVADLVAHRAAREAFLAQARHDAERWLDEHGSFRCDAVAVRRPDESFPPPATRPEAHP